ncbi:tetratricopeptide repeat protein [Candidatus Puniceispirillum marinum]|uniref:Sel1-like protein n=1 Tax=Puniceispirillum marinum (strain IMCC1322) TaxID=488538 RepID=D5BQQ0_PUNMI|nr:SEL1-like repeat protein [Candidatus Puniceispirillum marinum]ADE40768.1 Sel1-like protein [Candidatus Puniceispirillum marinum IMCC1322]
MFLIFKDTKALICAAILALFTFSIAMKITVPEAEASEAHMLPETAPAEIHAQLKAAHKRDTDAMFAIATYLLTHVDNDPENYDQLAFGWALNAARNGHAQASELTGVMYRGGTGVAQNYVKARKWLERALARQSMEPNFELALLYADENNPGFDTSKAGTFLAEAMRSEEPRACLISALNQIEDGEVIRSVLSEITCAAEGGVVDAMEMLGHYHLGRRSPYAFGMAQNWFERAAAKGSLSAIEKLKELTLAP